jgi:hypothetical protein
VPAAQRTLLVGHLGIGERRQPLVQPRAHLAGRLARERDGQDLFRRCTFEQRAHDA